MRQRSLILGLIGGSLVALPPCGSPSQASCTMRPSVCHYCPSPKPRSWKTHHNVPELSLLALQNGKQQRSREAGTKCHRDKPICFPLKVGETVSPKPGGAKALDS